MRLDIRVLLGGCTECLSPHKARACEYFELPGAPCHTMKKRGVKKMTREGAEIIRGAMRAISEQCMKTDSCNNCPFSCCCQCMDYSHETRPDNCFHIVFALK